MFRIRSFTTLLCSACLFCLGCQSSKNEIGTDACSDINLNFRVVNGRECSTVNSPVANLTILPTDGGIRFCSGTLVTPTHILTAAHCFTTESLDALEDGIEEEIRSVSAQLGSRDFVGSRIFIHPGYDGGTVPPQNDVAVVRLRTAVPNQTLPLLLSRTTEPDDIVSVFGFGLDEDQNDGILRSGRMRVLGTNSQFIDARFDSDGSNICSGDSGGPVTHSYTDSSGNTRTGIVAVTSFGESGCDTEETLSGFTNVQGTLILDFILNTVPNIEIR